jgi:hypothetical protein
METVSRVADSVRDLMATARLGIVAAGLLCACEQTWHIEVEVEVPPDVQASFADSLPAAVMIAGRRLDLESGAPAATTFAPRRIGLVCKPNETALSFRARVKDSGCGVETQVQAWLESAAGIRDFLARQPSVAGTDVSTARSPQGALSRDEICSMLEPLATSTISPSASPKSGSPHAEDTAFSGQDSHDCDRNSAQVRLVLYTPDP